jgi:hypothetical protein
VSLLLFRVLLLLLLLLIFLKSFDVNTPVLCVHATTPAASNGFDTHVPNVLATFAPLLLLHTLTLLQKF